MIQFTPREGKADPKDFSRYKSRLLAKLTAEGKGERPQTPPKSE